MESDTVEVIEKKSHAWGITGLVLGIISIPLMFMPYFGLPMCIIGLIAVGKQKKIEPSGYETAALILNIIGLVLNLIIGFIVAAVLMLGLM